MTVPLKDYTHGSDIAGTSKEASNAGPGAIADPGDQDELGYRRTRVRTGVGKLKSIVNDADVHKLISQLRHSRFRLPYLQTSPCQM